MLSEDDPSPSGAPEILSKYPQDWSDKRAWNDFFDSLILADYVPDLDSSLMRFLSFAEEKGGRTWFPGCGMDYYPFVHADHGGQVVATDFSYVAVEWQRRMANHLRRKSEATEAPRSFMVAEQDFTAVAPDGEFDVVLNIRAFQGLTASAMRAAARQFYGALRPGGACIVDTMNVQGLGRNWIEDSLIEAGFYIPFQASERWYREQLNGSGVVYVMILGRPMIPSRGQYPPDRFEEFAARDRGILESLSTQYEQRLEAEKAEVSAKVDNPTTKVAHVVYSTG